MNDNIPFYAKRAVQLTALEVRVGLGTKHVGKVGRAPLRSIPQISGDIILYKEVPFADVFCRKMKRYSIDRLAFDYAVERLGVTWLVMFVFDEAQTIIVNADHVRDSPISDLGERAQYRIKPADCIHISGEHRVNMGWTNHVRVVDELVGAEVQAQVAARRHQPSIFDL